MLIITKLLVFGKHIKEQAVNNNIVNQEANILKEQGLAEVEQEEGQDYNPECILELEPKGATKVDIQVDSCKTQKKYYYLI